MLRELYYRVMPAIFASLVMLSAGFGQRPNVLFICIDDLVPTLGCYGDEYAITPEIDAIAGRGTTFLNHHTQWPVCGPSRACLSTGLMPEETGVMGFRPMRALLPDLVTMPQHFKHSGYETGAVGKFHDKRTVGTIVDPLSPTTNGATMDDLASWSVAYDNGGSGYIPPVAVSGKKYATNYNTIATDPVDGADYTDGEILTRGLALIDQLALGDKPFFASVGFKKPHLPFVAPKSFWDLYVHADAPQAAYTQLPLQVSTVNGAALGDNGELRNYEPYHSTFSTDDVVFPTEGQKKELVHGYYACVSFVDDLVGQLWDKLEVTADPLDQTKTLDETTIVVIWGDHGFALGQHGKWAKHTNMEQSSSCPLIIFDPRQPAQGLKTIAPAQTVDIYPTLCELCGLTTPTQPLDENVLTGRPLAGRSLVSLLWDEQARAGTGAITQFSQNGLLGYAYRTEQYRYIEWLNSSGSIVSTELYDYSVDTEESRVMHRTDTNDSGNDVTGGFYQNVAFALSKALRREVSSLNTARSWDSGDDVLQSSASRLQASAPNLSFSNLSDRRIGNLSLMSGGEGVLQLEWGKAGNATYKIEKSDDLDSVWTAVTDHTDRSALEIPVNQPRQFFRVTLLENEPPHFLADPIVLPTGNVGDEYSQNLTAWVQESGVIDTVSFSKMAGPDWVSVSSAGMVTGTPPVGEDLVTYLSVEVEDHLGASSRAKIHFDVTNTNSVSNVTNFPVAEDTYVKQSEPLISYGSAGQIQLRQSGESNFSRLGYLKFNVSGVSSIASARLFLYSLDEMDSVTAYQVSDNSWAENSLSWDSQPIKGGLVASGNASSEAWFSIDLTSVVTTAGTYSFLLDEQGDSFGKLSSSSGGFTPYLEITHQ